MFGLGTLGKIDIFHDGDAIFPKQIDAGLHSFTDGIRHQRVDGASQDEVAINAFRLDGALHLQKVLGLKFGALLGGLEAMAGDETGWAVVRVRLEMAAFQSSQTPLAPATTVHLIVRAHHCVR